MQSYTCLVMGDVDAEINGFFSRPPLNNSDQIYMGNTTLTVQQYNVGPYLPYLPDMIIIVFDPSLENSFSHLDNWLQTAKTFQTAKVIALVAVDGDSIWQTSRRTIAAYAQKNSVLFFVTRDSNTVLFNDLVEKVMDVTKTSTKASTNTFTQQTSTKRSSRCSCM